MPEISSGNRLGIPGGKGLGSQVAVGLGYWESWGVAVGVETLPELLWTCLPENLAVTFVLYQYQKTG